MTIPARSERESRVLGWAKEARTESEAFLQAQEGYSNIQPAIDMISGTRKEFIPTSLSRTQINLAKKIFFDLSSGMIDTRPFWYFHTFNKVFERNAQILSKLSEHWYVQNMIDLKMLLAYQYAISCGTGYTHMFYDKNKKRIDVLAEDPRDVLPFRPSNNFSIQDAEGVMLRRARTLNYLKRVYPDKAGLLKATGETASLDPKTSRLLDNVSPLARSQYLRKQKSTGGRIPMVDVYTFYFKDDSVNKSQFTVGVGNFDDEGNRVDSMAYTVPAGDKLYPRGRLLVFTDSAILYDGPNPYWHGQFPVHKITLDPLAWSFLGSGAMWDLLDLQSALNKTERAIEDHLEKFVRPDLIADKNSVSRSQLRKTDTRLPGAKVEVNPSSGKGALLQYPNPLPPDIYAHREFLTQKMKELAGVEDLTNLAKLGQIPSSETIEKIAEAMTPAVRLRSRILEGYVREFAIQLAFNFSQFLELKERVQILGADGITLEDLDVDSNTMIPAWVDSEDYDADGHIKSDALKKPARGRYERTKAFMLNFAYDIKPGSLLSAAGITKKLLYLQLARAGLIDIWTLGEQLGIENMGEPPDPTATTITQRLILQQVLGLGMSVSPAGRKATAQEMPSQRPDGGISES